MRINVSHEELAEIYRIKEGLVALTAERDALRLRVVRVERETWEEATRLIETACSCPRDGHGEACNIAAAYNEFRARAALTPDAPLDSGRSPQAAHKDEGDVQ